MWSLAFSLPLALIALPWYARNWSKTLDHALKSSFSPMADSVRDGRVPILSRRSLGVPDPLGERRNFRDLFSAARGLCRNCALAPRSSETTLATTSRVEPLLCCGSFHLSCFSSDATRIFASQHHCCRLLQSHLRGWSTHVLSSVKRWGKLAFASPAVTCRWRPTCTLLLAYWGTRAWLCSGLVLHGATI